MDPLFKSLISTVLCVGGPLILWIAFRFRPDLFVGKLKQVKWLTAFFMALMFFTLAGSFWIERQHPPKPARLVAPTPVFDETLTTPVTPRSEQEGRARTRRFFEIEEKK